MPNTSRKQLIDQDKAGYQVVAETLAGATDADLDARPAPGKWSAREIVHHLANSEMTAAIRLRLLVATERPQIVGFDAETDSGRARGGAGKTMRALAPILVAAILTAVVASRPSPMRAQNADAQYAEAMRRGDELLMRREYMQALQAFRRADALYAALHDRTSAEANLGMARALRALKLHKDVVQSCDAGLKYPVADKRLEANLRNFRGEALLALATAADDPKLKDAETDFRASVVLSDAMPAARYNLGLALLKQHRDDEGVQALKAYLEVAGHSTGAEEARRLVDNPRRARENYAPEFSIRTLEGKTLALDDLKGKTVALDFWGTWCAPCVKATPDLARLNKKLAGQPFIMIGISSDKDDVKWREFIRKNNMDWPQYLDDGSVQRLFDVSAFPTYIVIDGEGIVRFRHSGASSESERRLEDAIKKSLTASAPRQ